MKYVILIHSNPASREIWQGLSRAERTEGLRAYEALNAQLAATGEMIVSEALAAPSEAKLVTAREGRAPLISDGPFAEAKEHLAGFYVIDCESMDRAVEIAAQVPEAALGLVEVRPVLSLEDLAM